MERLEYRLLDKDNGYPVIYSYENITEAEIAARFVCDYFFKDGVLYQKTACATEPLVYVIYVKKDEDVITEHDDGMKYDGDKIRVEVRQFTEEIDAYPLLFTYEMKEYQQAILYLQSDFFIWQQQEWQKTSAEIDEDRKVYVIYAQVNFEKV